MSAPAVATRPIVWAVAGPLLTATVAATLEALSHTWLKIPNPPAILLLTVVLSSFTGGVGPGLVSAILTWAYVAYFFATPGDSFSYTDENFRRVAVWAFTIPAMAIMVGILKRRADGAQAERARRESEARKGAILESALDSIISIDHQNRVIDFNPAAERMFGYARAQAIGVELAGLIIPPRLREGHRRGLARYLATGEATRLGQRLELQAQRADGTEFPIELTVTRIKVDGPPMFTAYMRDLTEHKRAEAMRQHNLELEAQYQRVQEATRLKSEFLAHMSHELRTPLIGVLGMLELLGRSRLDAGQRRQFDVVQRSAHSLLEIIGDILDYSKIEAGKIELEPETLSVRDLVSQVVGSFSATAQSKGLRLVQVVGAEVARAHVGDSVRLAQILRNFISNGIKFTEKGSVTVAVRVIEAAVGSQLLGFTVADSGIGMTPDQLGRLFQPFTQVSDGTTRRFGGTGLGLAICRRLADLMCGTLLAESEAGQGTTLTLQLRLPVGDPKDIAAIAREKAPPVATRPKPSREHAEREGSLLLLAEDHPVNRKVLAGQLNLAGFFVDVAEDGTRALELFGATTYGLVLTDLHMPGLDGYQLTAAIREFEAANGRLRTPILALTADVVREHVERCLASGMDDYLPKPVTIRQLVEKLQRWLPHLAWDATALVLPVNPSVLERSTDGDGDKVRQLLLQYCQANAEDLAALSEALREGNGAVVRVAHRIKGSAAMVGAHEVARIAETIERSARESPGFDAGELAGELARAAARVEGYVRGIAP